MRSDVPLLDTFIICVVVTLCNYLIELKNIKILYQVLGIMLLAGLTLTCERTYTRKLNTDSNTDVEHTLWYIKWNHFFFLTYVGCLFEEPCHGGFSSNMFVNF